MMLVQYAEIGGESRVGEILLPTLPVPGQHICFAKIVDAEGDSVEFRVLRATWVTDGAIVEGHIEIERDRA